MCKLCDTIDAVLKQADNHTKNHAEDDSGVWWSGNG